MWTTGTRYRRLTFSPRRVRPPSLPLAIPSRTDTVRRRMEMTAGPDVLAARLQGSPATRNIGVSNQGIGGNHLLTDGLGPNALARFDRDVLAPAGVQWVIVFEGVNDLGGFARDGEVAAAEHTALVRTCACRISTDHHPGACSRAARHSGRLLRLMLVPATTILGR